MGTGLQGLGLFRRSVSVVDAGGFTRADERVHRTQSTVSQQIRHLEDGFTMRSINRGSASRR
jgi:DNA-binding transcriptional LysR family regulator